jgi:hypothetical protein
MFGCRGKAREEIIKLSRLGCTLEKPKRANVDVGFTDLVLDLTRTCLLDNPSNRPSFSDILTVLEFITEPNRAFSQGRPIPSSVWKMLEPKTKTETETETETA